MKLLAFVFGEWVYRPYSLGIRLVLRWRGVRVGRNFLVQGIPRFLIRGKAENISIGDNVTFLGDVDIRNREDGAIQIGDGCRIDHGVRLVAARKAVLRLGEKTEIGAYSLFNCGASVTLGRKCMVSGFVHFQSSNHGTRRGIDIKDQPHTYAPIDVGDDVWVGANVTVLPGVSIGNGAILGAKAVVTENVASNTIVVGIPAKPRGERV